MTDSVNARRRFLRGMGTAGVAVGGVSMLGLTAGLAGCDKLSTDGKKSGAASDASQANRHPLADLRYDFYGEHQAGIVTPVQRHIYFLVADLHSTDKDAIAQMFKDWTEASAKLAAGENSKPYANNPHVPPADTGEADSLAAYGLTITFGISPSFLAKLGLNDKKPAMFSDLPNFPRDQIRAELSGGDICIQACAHDPQVAFHAVRQLVRMARSNITMKWSQAGFNSFDSDADTPRNLFGFKDGTANKLTLAEPDKHIWADDSQPEWFRGGSFLVARLIQMHLETWDRTALNGQEDTFSRHRDTGAPLGQTDEFAHFDAKAVGADGKPLIADIGHAALSNSTGLQLLRRSFSYSSGIDSKTGQFDAGLLFISFQKAPMQFIAIQNALGRVDKMNEYITHIGSGLFACFGGVREGEYLGQKLFEA